MGLFAAGARQSCGVATLADDVAVSRYVTFSTQAGLGFAPT